MTTREKMARDAAEGEIIGLRRAAKDHLKSARRARERGSVDLADSHTGLAMQFSMMANTKAKALGVDL